ncbi:MAG: thioredoxin fold domain-containing protein [Planctomycetota bacterium]|jgi:hypothetical protein
MAWKLLVVVGVCALSALGCGQAEAEASTRARGPSVPQPSAEPKPELPAAPVPAVFTKMSYAEAKRTASGSGRFLVVAGVDPWGSGGRMMDETTWSDPRVVAWIRRRAIAVRVDVMRDRERARELGIRVGPTIIVFSGNREIDRAVGYETPDRFLSWLEAARQRAGSR